MKLTCIIICFCYNIWVDIVYDSIIAHYVSDSIIGYYVSDSLSIAYYVNGFIKKQ